MKSFTACLSEAKSVNINIGVDAKDKRTIKKIESILDKDGIYYDNDGSDSNTHNINAGLSGSDIKNVDKYVDMFEKMGAYVDTETF